MKIGVAASRIGLASHVLRHWEDEGVVVPNRTAAGHRDYTDEHLQRLRIVCACQEVGLSLAEIRKVLHRGERERAQVIDGRLQAIQRQKQELEAAHAFLSHVRLCRHGLTTRCKDCSRYAQRWPALSSGPRPAS